MTQQINSQKHRLKEEEKSINGLWNKKVRDISYESYEMIPNVQAVAFWPRNENEPEGQKMERKS